MWLIPEARLCSWNIYCGGAGAGAEPGSGRLPGPRRPRDRYPPPRLHPLNTVSSRQTVSNQREVIC